jgi:ribonuclease HI
LAWVKRSLRGTEVWVRARPDGALDVDGDGRVDVRYKSEEGAKIYRAAARNLEQGDGGPAQPPAPARAEIIIYTDGACSGNPGPMGIGAVILRGRDRQEISEHIGTGTNNIAELTAVERALDALRPEERERPIALHADSSYVIGVLAGGFKAKKNVELIERIRQKLPRFPRLRFVKVDGHAGVAENERADQLATGAIARRLR